MIWPKRKELSSPELVRFVKRVSREVARGDADLAEEVEQHTHASYLDTDRTQIDSDKAWLRAVASNYLRRDARTRWNRPQHSAIQGEPAAPDREPSDDLMLEEERALVRDRLSRLDPRYEEVLRLRFMEGLPPRVVSERLGVPVNTIRSRTQRAVEALKAMYPEEDRRDRRWFGLAALLGWRRSEVLRLAGVVGLVAASVVSVLVLRGEDAPRSNGGVRGSAASDVNTALAETLNEESTERVAVERPPVDSPAEPAVPPAAARSVLVRGLDGAPASGVDVFAATRPLDCVSSWLGRTDGAGRLAVVDGSGPLWVTARGDVGQLSFSGHLDRGAEELLLDLLPVEVRWVEVVETAPSSGGPLVLVTDPVRASDVVSVTHGGLVRSRAVGVPAWRSPDGRFGLHWRMVRQQVLALRGDRAVWRSAVFSPASDLPDVLEVGDPWRATGRVVSALGEPLEGMPVSASPQEGGNIFRVQARSKADGTFELDMIDRGELVVGALAGDPVPVTSPERGDGLVDVGDLVIKRFETLASGHVDRPSAITSLRLVTKLDVSTPQGFRVLRQEGSPTTTVDIEANGTFELPVAAREISALVMDVAVDGGSWTALFRWEPGLWNDGRIDLAVPEQAPARLVIRDTSLVPGGSLLRLGVAPRVDVPVELREVPGEGLVGLFAPGRTDVSFRAADGRVVRWRALDLESGKSLVVEDAQAMESTLDIDWRPFLEAGDSDDVVQVRVGEVLKDSYKRSVTRGALPSLFEGQSVPAGQHVVLINDPVTGAWGASVRVGRGERASVALTRTPRFLAIGMSRPFLRRAFKHGRLWVEDAEGQVLATFGQGELLPTQQLELVVPRADRWIVRTDAPGVVPETVVENKGKGLSRTVRLRRQDR